MAGNTLKFVVEVAADQATQGLNAITTAVNQAGIQMRTTMLGVGAAAKQAGHASESFEDKLKEMKGEMASGDRTINFFARSLNGLVPATSMAGEGIRLIADGLIGGVGLGFAIQAGMAAMSLLGERFKEAGEEAEKLSKEKFEDLSKSVEKIAAAASAAKDKLLAMMGGDPEKLHLAQAYVKAVQDLQALGHQSNTIWDDLFGKDNGSARLTDAKQKVAEAKKAMIEYAEARKDIASGESAGKNWKEEFEAQVKAWEEGYKRRTAALLEHNKAADAAVKARVEESLQAERDEAEGLELIRKQSAARIAAQDAKATANWRSEFNAQVKAYEDGEKRKEAAAQQFASIAASSLMRVAEGQESLSDVMKSVAMSFVQQALEMAIQAAAMKMIGHNLERPVKVAEVTADAGVAAAGAAAAVAATPIVGPGLAAAAYAETMAMVLGAVPLASAAGGWKVPYDTLAMVHEDERILPARYSKGLDRLVNGGGAGGVTVNVSAVDRRSVERFFEDNDSAIMRAIRKNERKRRA